MNKKTTENQINEEEPEAEVAAEIAVDEDEKETKNSGDKV